MICGMDREVLDIWAEMGGVPNDPSTLEYAGRLCLKLWAELQEAWGALDDALGKDAEPVALPVNSEASPAGGASFDSRISDKGVS